MVKTKKQKMNIEKIFSIAKGEETVFAIHAKELSERII